VSSELAPTDCQVASGPCITCSDEGIPMRVLELSDQAALCVDGRGDRHQIAVDLVAPVQPADEILVHAGVAIRRLGVTR
jgi:hydrogenase maturation factor